MRCCFNTVKVYLCKKTILMGGDEVAFYTLVLYWYHYHSKEYLKIGIVIFQNTLPYFTKFEKQFTHQILLTLRMVTSS